MFPNSAFVADLEKTSFFLISDLIINNIALFLNFLVEIYKRSSLYQTTKVFLAFTERIV